MFDFQKERACCIVQRTEGLLPPRNGRSCCLQPEIGNWCLLVDLNRSISVSKLTFARRTLTQPTMVSDFPPATQRPTEVNGDRT
jgi:hypothetical protein